MAAITKHFDHKKAIDLSVKSGTHLHLHADTICTACYYLHKFNEFLIKNLSGSDENNECNYDLGVVVSTSLYIATKTNENHTQLSELISSVHFHLKNFDKIDQINYEQTYQLLPKDFNYWKLRDSITYFELLLLRIVNFKLIIDLPHKYLIFYLKTLNNWIDDDENFEKIFTFSWSIMNDYLCYHTESFEWSSKHIALAIIELAIEKLCPNMKKLLQIDAKTRKSQIWYKNLDENVRRTTIDNIIVQIKEIDMS